MPEIVIAIPTYRRPEALDNALTAVIPQIEALPTRDSCSVLVVDNDPAATGREVAERFGARYVVEPDPGIAAVRNRALAETADAAALIFIDDDEVPQPGWLAALLETYTTTSATAVAGRVITRFPDDVEPWVRASGAFVRPVRTDGQAIAEAATNNLLLDLASVRRLGLSFDARFGLTGGSDSLFTRALTAGGGTIRWAQDAVVIEQEEAARFTKRWVLMRTFRFGNTSARVRIALAHGPVQAAAQRLLAVGRGVARVAGGGARTLAGMLTGSLTHRARGLRTAYRGAGMIAGSVGYAHDEYGRRRRASAKA